MNWIDTLLKTANLRRITWAVFAGAALCFVMTAWLHHVFGYEGVGTALALTGATGLVSGALLAGVLSCRRD